MVYSLHHKLSGCRHFKKQPGLALNHTTFLIEVSELRLIVKILLIASSGYR